MTPDPDFARLESAKARRGGQRPGSHGKHGNRAAGEATGHER